MNQALIINDDYFFDHVKTAWRCTAFLSGTKVTLYIYSNINEQSLTQEIKFDWEEKIETLIDEQEADINGEIKMTIKD